MPSASATDKKASLIPLRSTSLLKSFSASTTLLTCTVFVCAKDNSWQLIRIVAAKINRFILITGFWQFNNKKLSCTLELLTPKFKIKFYYRNNKRIAALKVQRLSILNLYIVQ